MPQSATYRPPLLRRPNTAGGVNSTPVRCPFLGTSTDPGTALAFPSEANHCYRSHFPIPISTIHQENYCLSHQYETCPVYRQYSSEEERAEATPVPVPVAAVTVATPEPPHWAGESVGAAEAVAAGMALGTGRGPAAVALDEPIHPDFQAAAALSPRSARRSWDFEPRSVLLGLLVLAMLVMAGWAVLTFLGERGRADSQGVVVTLPTLAATVDMSIGQLGMDPTGTTAVGAAAEATATALGEMTTSTAATAASVTTAPVDSVAATATALFAGAVATAECRVPDWWVAYVTQAGDTVEALAMARGILPEELIVANCLAAPELTAGMELRLPPVGVIILLPVATATTAIPSTARPYLPTPTFPAIFPTRPPLLLPTPTFPLLVMPTPELPEPEPEDTPRPPRPTTAPPPPSNATSTPPTFPTTTPPIFGGTATPPVFGTVQPTKTPPGGPEVLPTVTGTIPATRTPPVP